MESRWNWKTKLTQPVIVLCAGAFLAMAVGLPAPVMAGVTEVHGSTGPGALYDFFVPDGNDGDHWNGDVVYFAHGYRDPSWPISMQLELAQIGPFRDLLLDLGYGFALSTYSSYGFSVKEGARQTHQLRGLFTSQFGKPNRSYIAGGSMGGVIAVALAEKYPAQYDGAFPFCGVVGGSTMAWEYVYGTRTIFDYYYPDVLPGDALDIPEGLDFGSQVVPAVIGAVTLNPLGLAELAGVKQLDIVYLDFGELMGTLLNRLYFHTVGGNEGIDRAHGHSPFGNMDTYYVGSWDDRALNDGVDRFESPPDARNHLSHHYKPTGRLRIPVLTLHTTRDPAVPMAHEDAFEDIVESAGSGEWLVRQHVERYGHCTFTPGEMEAAFMDLVDWVENGVVPSEGDVTQP